ncbi:C-type lectin domain family 4 member E-like [Crassostrea virginica]
MLLRRFSIIFTLFLFAFWIIIVFGRDGRDGRKITQNLMILKRSTRLRNVSVSSCQRVSEWSSTSSRCFSLCIATLDRFNSFSHNPVTKECRCCGRAPASDATPDEEWRTYSVEPENVRDNAGCREIETCSRQDCNAEGNWTEFAGHYYLYRNENVTWFDAKSECEKMCAYLVEIDSKEETDWLADTFLKSDKCLPNLYVICTSWTGGNDLDLEGQYMWDYSNTTFNYTNWLTDEPSGDSAMNTRDCVDMFWTGQWNDRPCTHLGPFICEKPRM